MISAIEKPCSLPTFHTGIPFVGTIDLNQKMEWLYWGGVAASLLLITSPTKYVVAAGIVALRYELHVKNLKPLKDADAA